MKPSKFKRHPTSKEIIIDFMTSYHDTILELKERQKYCKDTKQDTEEELLHFTLRIIQKYFNERGQLPV